MQDITQHSVPAWQISYQTVQTDSNGDPLRDTMRDSYHNQAYCGWVGPRWFTATPCGGPGHYMLKIGYTDSDRPLGQQSVLKFSQLVEWGEAYITLLEEGLPVDGFHRVYGPPTKKQAYTWDWEWRLHWQLEDDDPVDRFPYDLSA